MMVTLPKLKYPRLALLLLTFALAYLILAHRSFMGFDKFIVSLGLTGAFMAGVLYVYGFTAGPGTAILLVIAREENILLCGLIAGVGALIGDLLIFDFIRYSFSDEIKNLSSEKMVTWINSKLSPFLRKYLMPILGGVIIASPLPDEIGVSLFATATNISTRAFMVLSYVLNTAGIFVILLIGKAI
ncbi:MAG: hypothetical protein V1866_02930 [archaeon]